MKLRSAQERLQARLQVQADGCHVWHGHRSAWGYGQINVNNRIVYVHRQVWEWAHGPLPAGWEVDHLCRNRLCANLRHLEAVPKRVNTLRGQSPAAQHAKKTTCPNGHAYNTVVHRGNGRDTRRCSICTNARRRERYANRRETA